jgi:putative hemolysin
MIGVLLGVAGVLLLLSAGLSAVESAVFSVSASRLRTMREEGFRRADALHQVRSQISGMRSTLFYLNTALNLLVVTLGVLAAVGALGMGAAAWALPVGIVVTWFVAEGLPRILASRSAIRIGLLAAPVLLVLERLARPLLFPLLWLETTLGGRGNGEGGQDPEERELQELAELGRKEGVVEEEEHQLVERAFRMDELAAWDIMTPRVDIFAWDDSLTLEEVVGQLRDVPYSRVPVYRETIDEISGILYVREAYQAYVTGRGELPLSRISREPFFIPGSLPLPRLLRAFQARRIHMGIVADEFGGTDGLVTLEDVIEELVGEIEDETDVREEPIHRISRTEAEVEGGVELREVNYAMNVSLPHLEHRSLNGFVLEELGRVPETGERVELPGLEVEILEATETQIVRARLRKTQGAQPETAK